MCIRDRSWRIKEKQVVKDLFCAWQIHLKDCLDSKKVEQLLLEHLEKHHTDTKIPASEFCDPAATFFSFGTHLFRSNHFVIETSESIRSLTSQEHTPETDPENTYEFPNNKQPQENDIDNPDGSQANSIYAHIWQPHHKDI